MGEPQRWERDAERTRKNTPDWLNVDRLPWWFFAFFGFVVVARALWVPSSDRLSAWDKLGALVAGFAC